MPASRVVVNARIPQLSKSGITSFGTSRHVYCAAVLDARDRGAERVQALVDALVAALDLADVVDVLSPSAQSAASSIAMPARMSGDSTVPPRSCDGPATSARCGSQSTMLRAHADQLVDEEQARLEHLLVDENQPVHCVAVTIAIDIVSAGNAGHGWSSSFGTWPPRSLWIMQLLLGRDDQIVARRSSHSIPRRSKPMSVERRCSTPASSMRISDLVTAASPMNEPTSM